MSFYDIEGTLIGGDSFTYSAPNYDGILEWRGWHSNIPVHLTTISGAWVVHDSSADHRRAGTDGY